MALLLSDSNRFRLGGDVTSITGHAFRGAPGAEGQWATYSTGAPFHLETGQGRQVAGLLAPIAIGFIVSFRVTPGLRPGLALPGRGVGIRVLQSLSVISGLETRRAAAEPAFQGTGHAAVGKDDDRSEGS